MMRAVSISLVLAAFGCSEGAHESHDLTTDDTGADVESHDSSHVDGGDDSEVGPARPPFCGVRVPEQTWGEPGSCGNVDGFDAVTGCWFDYFGTQVPSMLCDAAGDRCTNPVRACAQGWCHIPAVSFQAGMSPDIAISKGDAILRDFFDPPSRKSVARGYFVQESEAGLNTFKRLMGYEHPDLTRCAGKGECPAVFGSIFEAMDFANRLGAEWGLPPCYTLEGCGTKVLTLRDRSIVVHTCERSTFVGLECRGLRLPTRAEAELSARAGALYAFQDRPMVTPEEPVLGTCDAEGPATLYAWHCGNAFGGRDCRNDWGEVDLTCLAIAPSRGLRANAFGLFDVQGNLLEFAQKSACSHDVENHCLSPMTDTDSDTVVVSKDGFMTTGGHYFQGSSYVASNIRQPYIEAYSTYKLQVLGLRLVRSDLGDCDSLVLPAQPEQP